MSSRLRLLALTLFAVLVASSCGPKRSTDEELQHEIAMLESKTIPSDAKVVARSAPVQSDWSVTASWDFETNSGTPEYSKWVISQLVPEYKVVENDVTRLTLSKVQDGDTHSVDCRFDSANNKLHVHVVFSARPD